METTTEPIVDLEQKVTVSKYRTALNSLNKAVYTSLDLEYLDGLLEQNLSNEEFDKRFLIHKMSDPVQKYIRDYLTSSFDFDPFKSKTTDLSDFPTVYRLSRYTPNFFSDWMAKNGKSYMNDPELFQELFSGILKECNDDNQKVLQSLYSTRHINEIVPIMGDDFWLVALNELDSKHVESMKSIDFDYESDMIRLWKAGELKLKTSVFPYISYPRYHYINQVLDCKYSTIRYWVFYDIRKESIMPFIDFLYEYYGKLSVLEFVDWFMLIDTHGNKTQKMRLRHDICTYIQSLAFSTKPEKVKAYLYSLRLSELFALVRASIDNPMLIPNGDLFLSLDEHVDTFDVEKVNDSIKKRNVDFPVATPLDDELDLLFESEQDYYQWLDTQVEVHRNLQYETVEKPFIKNIDYKDGYLVDEDLHLKLCLKSSLINEIKSSIYMNPKKGKIYQYRGLTESDGGSIIAWFDTYSISDSENTGQKQLSIDDVVGFLKPLTAYVRRQD